MMIPALTTVAVVAELALVRAVIAVPVVVVDSVSLQEKGRGARWGSLGPSLLDVGPCGGGGPTTEAVR